MSATKPVHGFHGEAGCRLCKENAATVPRVATSLDDLRVGQVVAWKQSGHPWEIVNVTAPEHMTLVRSQCVILSDPPPEPVPVPRELVDALAEALDFYPDATTFAHPDVFQDARIAAFQKAARAARALVDAVRGAE